MIILLDTSTPICKTRLIEENWSKEASWQSERNLARDLLHFLRDTLSEHGKTWQDLSGIGVFEGPGSFTGLRIGITVMNTIAEAESIPIVGGRGDHWQDEVLKKLTDGNNERVVLPYYDREANITKPRK